MKTLATTTKAADWFRLGHLANHSAAITAQPTAITIEATLRGSGLRACGREQHQHRHHAKREDDGRPSCDG